MYWYRYLLTKNTTNEYKHDRVLDEPFLMRLGGKEWVEARPIHTVREVASFPPQQPLSQPQHLHTQKSIVNIQPTTTAQPTTASEHTKDHSEHIAHSNHSANHSICTHKRS